MDPGIDGTETYRRILEINPVQKAVIVSGFSETDRVRKAQKMGAGTLVSKSRTFLKTLVSLLERNWTVNRSRLLLFHFEKLLHIALQPSTLPFTHGSPDVQDAYG